MCLCTHTHTRNRSFYAASPCLGWYHHLVYNMIQLPKAIVRYMSRPTYIFTVYGTIFLTFSPFSMSWVNCHIRHIPLTKGPIWPIACCYTKWAILQNYLYNDNNLKFMMVWISHTMQALVKTDSLICEFFSAITFSRRILFDVVT